jgi:hypothetical protein
MKKYCITSVKKPKHVKQDNDKIEEPISVVLLYDAAVNRMKSYGPIALFNINEQTKIIDYHISFIHAHFTNPEIVICVGSDSEKIIKYVQTRYHNTNIRIVENQIYQDTNTCESLRLCLNNISSSNILLINALTLPKKINKTPQSGVMLYIANNSKKSDIGANINENNKVEHMSFYAKNTWLDIMWVSNKSIITTIKKILAQDSYKKKMWFELINEMIARKINIDYSIVNEDILKIDNLKQYKYSNGEKE